MVYRAACSAVAVGLSGGVGVATAQDLSYLSFKDTGSEGGLLVLVAAAAAVVGVIWLLRLLNNRVVARRRAPPAPAAEERHLDFAPRAARMGFRIVEIKALKVFAARLNAGAPGALLSTDEGRERLIAEIGARLRRREREVAVLRSVHEKLCLIRDHQLRERASVRVETDLAVWVVRKNADRAQRPAGGDDEELETDADQIPGRLVDLSEGGAAVATTLTVEAGELVELWSADPEVWLPPITGGVLHAGQREGVQGQVLHLHFVDPPLADLRAVVLALRRQADQRAT
jgi:hypothetical protein